MPKTELVFLLDRSGSMAGLEADTIGGFNAMLAKQKKKGGNAVVSTILFNHECKTIHDRVNIADIKNLGEDDYEVFGNTALLDALGGSICHIKARQESTGEIPERTAFFITTDGMENASRAYGSKAVKKMVERQQREGWEFFFLAANIDAVETAGRYGIGKERAVQFGNDCRGIARNFEAVSNVCECLAQCGKIEEDWKKSIEEEYLKFKERNFGKR